MRVFAYWNLHRGCFSLKALEGPNKGRVVHRAPVVVLRNAEGKVSETGRQRVLRERKKNVHAGIVGEWNEKGSDVVTLDDKARRVTYNPYKYDRFVYADDETPYEGSDVAVLVNKAVYVA